MLHSPKIEQLIQAFKLLPGVGPKTAQRLAMYILTDKKAQGSMLANSLLEAVDAVQLCQQCHMLTETPLCHICSQSKRDQSTLCVVESASDVIAIEQSASYRGLYFVLKGHLSPIDGIGPEEIGVHKLTERCQHGSVREIILATNSTVEGEATAQYIAETLKAQGIATSRIAHGIPLGGELEYIDAGTIARALQQRAEVA